MDHLSYTSYRTVPPEETYARVQPFFTGMGITRVANITGLDQIGIPVYIAVRPNSCSLALAQGKGLNALNAKLSAIMETIESYHAEYPVLNTITASIHEMETSRVTICDYNALPSLSADQLEKSKPFIWTEGTNLLNGTNTYVPYEAVHTDMRIEASIPSPYFMKTSNGLASGNTMQEAVNHAVCELIERDSYSCWTLLSPDERAATKVMRESIQNDICQAVLEKFSRAETHVGIWNLTSDIGIPAFLVRILPTESPPFCSIPPASGFGCHPDKNLALIRALTEAAQSRLTLISGARDDIRLSHYRTFTTPEEYKRWHHSIFVQPSTQDFDTIPTFRPNDVEDVWSILSCSLQSAAIQEIISVDLSRPGFGIAVSKVLIPGLEGSEPYTCMRMGKRAQNIIEHKKAELMVYA